MAVVACGSCATPPHPATTRSAAFVPPGGTEDLQPAQLPPLIVPPRPRFLPEYEDPLCHGDIADADEGSQDERHSPPNYAETEQAPSPRIAPRAEPFECGGRGPRGDTEYRVDVDARRQSIRQGKDALANDPAKFERPHSKVKPPVKSAAPGDEA